ncbi:hypothetical protein R50073_05190 [Maricurvus nonylphenolicus]|uniref:GspH/FimT family pseudopilin n=1 Tax=Maricurvus nonylphenolicus TaxID=1008307 RepID=UPI0036F242B5
MSYSANTHTQVGFSLAELLVSLGILGVIAALAAPAFNDLMDSSARRSSLASFTGSLQFARGEAVGKQESVIICSSADGATCAGNNNWDSGWVVFVDDDGNGAPNYGGGTCDINEDCLVKSQAALTGGVTLRSNANRVTFNELGEMVGGAGTAFTLCEQDADNANDTRRSNTLNITAAGTILAQMGTVACP